jgi:hypothetical protein
VAPPIIGYAGKLSKGGTPTVLAEALCTLVSGKTYQLNVAAYRVLDPNTPIVVNDWGTIVAPANIVSVNAMNGQVTFAPGYTPLTGQPAWAATTSYPTGSLIAPTTGVGRVFKATTGGTSGASQPSWTNAYLGTFTDGSVTWTECSQGGIELFGKYIPRAAVAAVKAVKTLSKLEVADVTTINSTGLVMRAPTLRDFTGSFDLFDYASDQGFDLLLLNRTPVLVDFDPNGAGTQVSRAWVTLTQESGEIDPKSPLLTSVTFAMYDQSNAASALSGFTVNAAFASATT